MHNARWRESTATGGNDFLFSAHLDFGLALQHDVEFFLALMRVRGMFLSGLKAIETREERLTMRDGGFGHFRWREFGIARQVLDDGGECGKLRFVLCYWGLRCAIFFEDGMAHYDALIANICTRIV